MYPFNVGDSRWVLIKFKSIVHKAQFDSEVSKIITKPHHQEERKFSNMQSDDDNIFKTEQQFLSRGDVTDDIQDYFEAVPLTTDHTPEVDMEHRRILQYGGRIDTVKSKSSKPLLYKGKTATHA